MKIELTMRWNSLKKSTFYSAFTSFSSSSSEWIFIKFELLISFFSIEFSFSKYFSRRAFRFRHKYLKSLRYRNFYLTKNFYELDRTRVELGMETILPLTYKERKKLVEMKSVFLVRKELRHIFSSSIFLIFSTFHIIGILMTDFSLFWILSMIQKHGNNGSEVKENEGK